MARRKPTRRANETKRDDTRRVVLDAALALFQKRGVEQTTMRDIAKRAGMSLGAAYYYFPSKEALVFAYYDDNIAAVERAAATTKGTTRERLGSIFHDKLTAIRPYRTMLASILPHLIDPRDPLSAFSSETREVRHRALAMFERAIEPAQLPPSVATLVANALWLLQLASMLLYVHDDSVEGRRTHGLVDDGLDLVVPLLPLLASPMGIALCDRVIASLTRAGIAPLSPPVSASERNAD